MSKLSNIEQEMKEALKAPILIERDGAMVFDADARAKAAAEVAKKYIEKAHRHGIYWRERYCEFKGATDTDYEEHCQEATEKWLKENGIE